ncbi:MAG: hypothetical protein LC785_17880, partial [Acidobacteria bacterium]|nr:hypothetical protein [Acidobacteriota bacterium]
MKIYSSPAARRVSRAALSALFTVALLFGALAPLASEVAAKSRPQAKRRSRSTLATAKRVANRRRAKQRAARAEAEELEKYDESSAGEEGEDNAEKREEWFRLQREYPSGAVPPDARRRAWESRPKGRLKGDEGRGILSVDATQWTPIGPAPSTPKFPNNWGITSGRINAIAVKPDETSVVIVGASTGGIWRSTDGGTTFAPASDSQVDLSVGSIAFAPSNPSIVYAGMGDIGNGYLGTGVLKSTDGGASWTRVSQVLGTDCTSLPAFNTPGCLPAPATAMNVLVDPSDPNRVYLTQYNYVNTSTNGGFASGFYISTDGGATWRRTLSGLPRDLVMHPTNPSILYLAMRRVDTGQQLPGLYKSTDSGLTWTRVYDSPYDTAYVASPAAQAIRDIRVAVTPAAPENVYVFAGKTTSPTNVRVNVSTDGGATWPDKDTRTVATGVDPGQFGYNTYIAVDPSNPNTIYVGTRDVYKSTDGGATWTGVTKNFSGSNFGYNPFNSTSHPDQHCFAFSPGSPQTFYIGNDGGVSKTTTGGDSPGPGVPAFTSLNSSLSLSQFVRVVSHPTDPNFQIGGTQDNGTQVRLAAGNGLGWTEFAEGDGGNPVINPADPRGVLSTYIFGRIRRWQFNPDGTRSEKGGASSDSTFCEPSTGARIAFYPPFTGNGVDSTVYFGTSKLFISQNFADTVNVTAPTWSPQCPASGATDLTKGNGDVLTAIGVQRTPYSASQVIYTGSAGGQLMISKDGGASWTPITFQAPNSFN